MAFFILLVLFHSSLFAFLLHAVQSDKSFNFLVKLFIILVIIHGLLIFLEIGTPVVLLYGPIVLGLQRQMNGRKILEKHIYIHVIPFLLMTIFYSVLYFVLQFNRGWSASLLVYYPIYFFLMILSLVIYGGAVWLAKERVVYSHFQHQLVLQLSVINLITALFISILFASFLGKLDIDIIGFNSNYIIYGLLLVAALSMSLYLVNDNRNVSNEFNNDSFKKSEDNKYITSVIEVDVLDRYKQALEKVMEEEKLYLKSGLSLDELSLRTGISKHHFSQLFNVHLGRTFYQYIAEYRIQEAISRIESDDNITMESLAFECGFNSKTSFNKYFKNITGLTPSEYRVNARY